MRRIAVVLALAALSVATMAQRPTIDKQKVFIPQTVLARDKRMSSKLAPTAKVKIQTAAEKLLQATIVKESTKTPFDETHTLTIGTFPVLGDMSNADIEAIMFLVMSQAAKSADEDLKQVMQSVKEISARKDALRKQQEELKKFEANAKDAVKNDPKIKVRIKVAKPKPKTSETKYLKLPIAVLGPETKLPANVGSMSKQQLSDLEDSIKNDLDSMSEMGETESLRLQLAMDRLSKMMSTLSNILKKMSDTDSSIVQNIK